MTYEDIKCSDIGGIFVLSICSVYYVLGRYIN